MSSRRRDGGCGELHGRRNRPDNTLTSAAATLTVVTSGDVPTSIAGPTPPSQTINAGGTATFTATAVGGVPPFTYQWKNTGVGDVAGATTSSLSLPGVLNASEAVTMCASLTWQAVSLKAVRGFWW